MKFSEKPTDNILVTANCNSEWDNCDFAIISGGKAWTEWLQARLEVTRKIQEYDDFCCLKFFDFNVKFYISNEGDQEEILEKIKEKSWAFIELEDGEEEKFSVPENRLDCHTISLFTNCSGKYIAYGKHTGEEFYTDSIPFTDVLRLYADSEVR